MARRLIAATLSLSLGLSGLAPAPALAQDSENMGRLIGGLVALGVIGAAAHKEREKDREKEEKRAEKAKKEARKEAKKAAKKARKEREERREEAKDRLEEQLERLTEAEEDRRDSGGDARTRAALGALGAIIAGEGAAGGIEAITRELGLDPDNAQAEARAQAQARERAEAEAQARAEAEAEARRAEIVRQAEEARLAELARDAEERRRAEARARLDAQTGPRAAEALPPVPRDEVTADLLRDWEPAPAPRQPETTTPVATGEIPFACLRRQQAGFEAASVVDGDCLDDYPVLSRSFPLDCAVTGQSEGRITSGYDTQCLRDRGYRVAVR